LNIGNTNLGALRRIYKVWYGVNACVQHEREIQWSHELE